MIRRYVTRISSAAAASTNSRSQDTETGPSTRGASGNGVATDLATPPQIHSVPDCIAIQAPIMTSIVVSMSEPRRGRSNVSSIAAPNSHPASTATGSARKKFSPSCCTTINMM